MPKKKHATPRAWTPADVRTLKALAKARHSGAQTAKKLGRTAGAVAQKAMALGVHFRSVSRPGQSTRRAA